jgi:hypothetical protein
MADDPFVEFAKIFRLRRPIIVTEKIDGTNGCVRIAEDGTVTAGSRSRWLTAEADNFGFAKWVAIHAPELQGLGPGTHFGEWWGAGIQRRYGLDHKRFSLFNVGRWNAETPPPPCCHVVPVLGRFETFDLGGVSACLEVLKSTGSVASPGFPKPEGVVIFHVPSGFLFKQTIDKDDEPKRQSTQERTT